MSRTAPEAIQQFWEQFLRAYDENTVPDGAVLPRITYSYSRAEFGPVVPLSASIWDRSYRWEGVETVAEEIYETLGLGGIILEYDDGKLWLRRGTPFSQRMAEADDAIRRIYINIEAEFLTAI